MSTWWLKTQFRYLLLSHKFFLQRSSFFFCCLQNSLSALSSSLRSFTSYPYVMQDISVFKLQSWHFFVLWCLNMLIFQCQETSDTSPSDLRHHVWGWVYKISPFHCSYKSYTRAFRKYPFPPFCQLLKKNLNICVTIK